MTDLPSREYLRTLPFDTLRGLLSDVAHALQMQRGSGRSTSARLAKLEVGESTLFDNWSAPHQLRTADKHHARVRLDDQGANWSARTTTKGVRVTRIA